MDINKSDKIRRRCDVRLEPLVVLLNFRETKKKKKDKPINTFPGNECLERLVDRSVCSV